METLAAIFTRRSIRKYTDEPVSEADIDTLLKAAMVAPSAMDERPWHFVVVRNRKALKTLAGRMDHCDMLNEAVLGLLVCGDPSLEKIPGTDFWAQDCAACAQTIHLAAHAMGLGSVWVAAYPLEERMAAVREVLGLPRDMVPFAIVAAGHPAEHLEGEDRFDASRVHDEQWGQPR